MSQWCKLLSVQGLASGFLDQPMHGCLYALRALFLTCELGWCVLLLSEWCPV